MAAPHLSGPNASTVALSKQLTVSWPETGAVQAINPSSASSLHCGLGARQTDEGLTRAIAGHGRRPLPWRRGPALIYVRGLIAPLFVVLLYTPRFFPTRRLFPIHLLARQQHSGFTRYEPDALPVLTKLQSLFIH